jgi:hypothetical protein
VEFLITTIGFIIIIAFLCYIIHLQEKQINKLQSKIRRIKRPLFDISYIAHTMKDGGMNQAESTKCSGEISDFIKEIQEKLGE